MYINQYSNSIFSTASSQGNSRTNQNSRTNENNSGMPDFSSMLQNQRNDIMPQMPDDEQNSGIQPVMPGRVPSMPPSGMPEVPENEDLPEIPEGEEIPERPDDLPEIPDGEEIPAKPDDLPEIPAGEEPPAKPEGSDGEMSEGNSNMPPMMPGMPGRMQRSMSGGFNNSMNFMNR